MARPDPFAGARQVADEVARNRQEEDRFRRALADAGITLSPCLAVGLRSLFKDRGIDEPTIVEVAAVTDEQLLAIWAVGPARVAALRDQIDAWARKRLGLGTADDFSAFLNGLLEDA